MSVRWKSIIRNLVYGRHGLLELYRRENGFFGIDQGPSSGEIGATNALTGESGFAGSVGEGLLSNSSSFINALLSGDHGKIAQLLAPQISAISKQANEKTQTNAQFGNRSGGTNASNQNTMDSARASVNDMIASLTGSAVGEGLSSGSNLLNSSMSGYNSVFSQNEEEQKQRAAKWNDIIGSSLAVASMGVGGAAGVMATPAGASTGEQWMAGLTGAGF